MDRLEKQIHMIAANAVTNFQDRAREKVDYSQSSLEIVEEMLAEASDFVIAMDKNKIDSLVEMFGCYILEVAHQEFGRKFLWHSQYRQPLIVVGQPDYRIAIITFNKVKNRLLGDKADNIPFFYSGFANAVRKAEVGSNTLYL